MADVLIVGEGGLCGHCGYELGTTQLCPGCKAYTVALLSAMPPTPDASGPLPSGMPSAASSAPVEISLGHDGLDDGVHDGHSINRGSINMGSINMGCLVLEAKGFDGLYGAISALAAIECAAKVDGTAAAAAVDDGGDGEMPRTGRDRPSPEITEPVVGTGWLAGAEPCQDTPPRDISAGPMDPGLGWESPL